MIAMWLGGMAAGWGVGGWILYRRGHNAGWYHGYAARMYETFDGENYR